MNSRHDGLRRLFFMLLNFDNSKEILNFASDD